MDLTDAASDVGVARLIDRAVELHASDLFIVANEQHSAVQVRLRGLVEPLAILAPEQGKRFVARIRAEAGMDVGDHRRPHDGRWLYRRDDDHGTVDLRISIVPTLYGEDLAVRLLDRDINLMGVENLGMTPRQLEVLRPILEQSGGMVLLTGPTGSGKTVTMYAALGRLNDGHHKIHTIEDPIEYAVDGLRQSQVNPQIHLGPDEILKGVLRQAPDVIMLGEVRDEQTAHSAAWAANSGILVLSTIHSPSAAGCIQSLRGFGISPPFIASSLRAALGQRLVRTLCPACQDIAEESASEEVERAIEEIRGILPHGHPGAHYAARGCEQCHHTGYAGCTAVFEVMPITDEIRDLIIRGRSTREIHNQAVEEGMLTLRQAALLKVAQGRTTLEEVRRAVPDMPMETHA